MQNLNKSSCLIVLGLISQCFFSAVTYADSQGEVMGQARPIFDARVRYEHVDQPSLPSNANAMTVRARLGFETDPVQIFSLLAEGELLGPIIDHYRDDPTVLHNTQYPVVPDGESYEVNRLQLTYTGIVDTRIIFGRQRIQFDDQRFVGNFSWRQNEQTFDALRASGKILNSQWTWDASFAYRVNRVFGQDSPQGAYDGRMWFGNVAYPTVIGKFTAFNYLLDFNARSQLGTFDPARSSSNTLGLRFAGAQRLGTAKLAYTTSFARQWDFGNNPANFNHNYFLAELSVDYQDLMLKVGKEVLQGDGVTGFATPLASLHSFQGWADQFSNTPADGIDDRYIGLGYTLRKQNPFDSLSVEIVYHDYESEHLNYGYGSEVGLQTQAKWQRFAALLKYANFAGVGAVTDVKKIIAQLEFVW